MKRHLVIVNSPDGGMSEEYQFHNPSGIIEDALVEAKARFERQTGTAGVIEYAVTEALVHVLAWVECDPEIVIDLNQGEVVSYELA